MSNDVAFDLTLAISQYNKSLQKANQNMGKFTNSFSKSTKNMNGAWNSFVGNLGAKAVSFAVEGIANLTSGMISFTKEAILAAVEAQETASKFDAVFSDIGKSSDKAAKDLQKNFGLGVTESKELLSATGDLLTGFGFAQDGALQLSVDVQKLSVDLASFTNFSGGAKGASEAITKALLGETESMKALGVSINQKAVADQVALNTTKGLTFETERQAKAQATLDLIVQQSGNAIGDYAKTNKGAANQLKLFNKRIEDLTIYFGENFLPILEPVIQMVNKFIESLDIKEINTFIKSGLASMIEGFGSLVLYINPVVTAIKNMGSVLNIVQNGITAGLATISLGFVTLAKGIVETMSGLLNALPSTLVPAGWLEGMEEASTALDETMNTLVESIIEDSDDMKSSMDNIFNPEDILSESTIETILGNVKVVKEGIIKARVDVETDAQKRQKSEAKLLATKTKEDKKLQDSKNKEALKQSEFETALFGKTQDSMTAWQDSSGKQRADNLKSTLGTMATLSKSGNKTLADIGKASAITTATIDGFAAVQKALASAPPPLNFALASVVGVATAANIAGIAGVNFAHGGIVGGSSFTGDNVGINVNSGEMILNRSQQAELFQQSNGLGSGSGDVIGAINALGDRISNMEVVLVADDNEIARSTSRGVEAGVVIGRS